MQSRHCRDNRDRTPLVAAAISGILAGVCRALADWLLGR